MTITSNAPMAALIRAQRARSKRTVSRETRLLPDAKFPEDLVEHVFDIDRARDPADRTNREAEIFSNELSRSILFAAGPRQRRQRIFQSTAMTLTRQHSQFWRVFEFGARAQSNGINQFAEPLARCSRDPQACLVDLL